MNKDRYAWQISVIAGMVGGGIPLMTVATLPGLFLMMLILPFPFAWVTLNLGAALCVVSTLVAGVVVGIVKGVEAGFFFALTHGFPFIVLSFNDSLFKRIDFFKKTPMTFWRVWLVMACFFSFYIQWRWQSELQEGMKMMHHLFRFEENSFWDMESQIKFFVKLVPGLAAQVWACNLLLNIFLAEKLNLWMKWPSAQPLQKEPFHLSLEHIGAVIGASILGYATHTTDFSFIFWNLCIVLLLPGLLTGFHLVHLFAQTRSFPRVFLISFYMMVLGIVWIFPLVIVIGFLEPWLQLESKISRLGPHDGE